jgi:hypothetical protein
MATYFLLGVAAASSARVAGSGLAPLQAARARVVASLAGAPQPFGGDASMPPSLLADAWGKADKVGSGGGGGGGGEAARRAARPPKRFARRRGCRPRRRCAGAGAFDPRAPAR